jgi:hypothetical protein
MGVVVLDVLAQHGREVARSGDQEMVEAFAAQRVNPALGDRVRPRRALSGANDADVGAGEHRVEAAVNLDEAGGEARGGGCDRHEQSAPARPRQRGWGVELIVELGDDGVPHPRWWS